MKAPVRFVRLGEFLGRVQGVEGMISYKTHIGIIVMVFRLDVDISRDAYPVNKPQPQKKTDARGGAERDGYLGDTEVIWARPTYSDNMVI
jgi:hypothetical protein